MWGSGVKRWVTLKTTPAREVWDVQKQHDWNMKRHSHSVP